MKKAFCILALIYVILFSACDNKLDDVVIEQENKVSNFVVPIDDAIAEMNDVLSIIDVEVSHNSLRSSERKTRTIETIEVVNHGSFETNRNVLRSESTEPLFYLVNFEDDQGYAVLAADSRISSSVLAVVESGSISVADFSEGDYLPYDSSVDYGYDDLKDFSLYNVEFDDYYVGLPMPAAYMLLDYADREISGGSRVVLLGLKLERDKK